MIMEYGFIKDLCNSASIWGSREDVGLEKVVEMSINEINQAYSLEPAISALQRATVRKTSLFTLHPSYPSHIPLKW